MCKSAMYWANISLLYYTCSRDDVFQFGFPDRFDLREKRNYDHQEGALQITRRIPVPGSEKKEDSSDKKEYQ